VGDRQLQGTRPFFEISGLGSRPSPQSQAEARERAAHARRGARFDNPATGTAQVLDEILCRTSSLGHRTARAPSDFGDAATQHSHGNGVFTRAADPWGTPVADAEGKRCPAARGGPRPRGFFRCSRAGPRGDIGGGGRGPGIGRPLCSAGALTFRRFREPLAMMAARSSASEIVRCLAMDARPADDDSCDQEKRTTGSTTSLGNL